jgi:hypothetical protein
MYRLVYFKAFTTTHVSGTCSANDVCTSKIGFVLVVQQLNRKPTWAIGIWNKSCANMADNTPSPFQYGLVSFVNLVRYSIHIGFGLSIFFIRLFIGVQCICEGVDAVDLFDCLVDLSPNLE